ncbi:MAG TPA: RNA polymerase sigma factor RpoD/SigA [Candidatus Eisenbacteria bacterium]
MSEPKGDTTGAGSPKAPVPFKDLLAQALEGGKSSRRITQKTIDRLLAADDFDDTEFELFVDLARDLEIEIHDYPETANDIDKPTPELDSLKLYLADISRYPLLKAEEEISVGKNIQEGTTPHIRQSNRKRMILSNLRLVVKIARAYSGRGVPIQDLIEEGNLGLITAVDRFDYKRGFRFSTYGSWWIKQSIIRGIATQSHTVRIPLHVIQLVNRYIATESRIRHKTRSQPTLEEVALAMGEPPKRIQRLKQLIDAIKGLDYETSWEALGALSEVDVLKPPPSLESQIDAILENERILKLMGRLSPREETVLRIRYGFNDGESHTLSATGEQIGVSRERVRQIEKRALQKMKRYIELTEQGLKIDQVE